jgi:hypothetical protein
MQKKLSGCRKDQPKQCAGLFKSVADGEAEEAASRKAMIRLSVSEDRIVNGSIGSGRNINRCKSPCSAFIEITVGFPVILWKINTSVEVAPVRSGQRAEAYLVI